MEYFGFDAKREFLPQYSYWNTAFKKRKMFLHFFNLLVEDGIFTKKDLCGCKTKSLSQMFRQKIEQLTTPSFVISCPLYFDSSLNRYMAQNKIKHGLFVSLKNKSYQKAVKLTSFIDNDSNSLLLDSDLLFKSFVHKSIISIKRDRVVNNEKDCIDMYLKHDSNIKVLPFWKRGAALNNAHVKKAIECIKSSEFKNIYLVYPKEDGFKKHIDIKVPELEGCSEYVIKMIPYSLKTIL